MEPDSTLYCAMWNDSINENQGGWDTTHCRTYTELSTDTVTCACSTTGAITILLVHPSLYLSCMDGWMDGWMDEWMDGWMDGWIYYLYDISFFIS